MGIAGFAAVSLLLPDMVFLRINICREDFVPCGGYDYEAYR